MIEIDIGFFFSFFFFSCSGGGDVAVDNQTGTYHIDLNLLTEIQ